ncbi:MAG: alpha/beta fold hydrolase, partial [Planctomycetales bacterium]|nr:alpha/beta fold hydrolase [Planctomycetales bacterium]
SVWVRFYPTATQGAARIAPLPPAVKSARQVEGEACEFQTRDGLTLRGTYLRTECEPRRGVIVFCHPLFASRWAVTDHLAALRRGGFDVFAFDFRNHGSSDKKEGYYPRPNLTRFEVDDLSAAIDYVSARHDADPRGVGLIGLSKGGAAALHLATTDDRVWAVVADSAFSVDWITSYYFRRYVGIFTPVAASVVRKMPWFLYLVYARFIQARVARQLGVKTCDLLYVLDRVQPPVFLIHGGQDQYVPVEMAHTLKRRIGRQCKLWIVERANHNEALHQATAKYEDRMVRFLAKHCGQDQWSPATLPLEERPLGRPATGQPTPVSGAAS